MAKCFFPASHLLCEVELDIPTKKQSPTSHNGFCCQMKYDCHVKFKSLPLGTCQKQAGIWQSPIWLVFQRLAWHKSNIAHAIFVVEKRRTLHCIHTDWKTSRPTTASNLYTANQGRWHTLWGGSVLVVAASSHVRKSTGPQKRFVKMVKTGQTKIFSGPTVQLCFMIL
jgi:hypothetical protein